VFGAKLRAPFQDTHPLHHCIDETRGGGGLDVLCTQYVPEMGEYWVPLERWRDANLTEEFKYHYGKIPIELLFPYGCGDTDATIRLLPRLHEAASRLPATEGRDISWLYKTIKLPNIPAIVEMELNGLQIDRGYVELLNDEENPASFAKQVNLVKSATRRYKAVKQYEKDRTEIRVNKKTGETTTVPFVFNPASTPQIRDILYDEAYLNSPINNRFRTDTKQPGTGEEALTELSHSFAFAQSILDYRELDSVNKTFVKPVLSRLDSNNVIHPHFNQAGTQTFRYSSNDPNAQNLPKLYLVKRQFISRFGDNGRLITRDLSQAELCVLAASCYSGAKVLRDAAFNRFDMHLATARKMFIHETEISKNQRKAAKTFNFAILYGMDDPAVARALSKAFGRYVSISEAEEFRKVYFRALPEVEVFINRVHEELESRGFVVAPTGFARHLPLVHSPDMYEVLRAKRQAVNFLVQHLAAEVTNAALSKVHEVIEENGLKSKLVLTVHDMIMVDAVLDEVEIVSQILDTYMTNPPFDYVDVPLYTDLEVLENWGDGEPDSPMNLKKEEAAP
jgi:DNA polymerase-1